MPSLLEAVNTRIISLLTSDIKTCKLISVNSEIMEEAIKNQNIETKILTRRNRAMWDIVLATEDAAKELDNQVSQAPSGIPRDKED